MATRLGSAGVIVTVLGARCKGLEAKESSLTGASGG